LEAGPKGWLPEGQKLPYITKIEMRGFKSFGNSKVTIPLSKGLTAVVGPNGHGKSNIVDALDFVMGSLSAKTLRAERFSDLLFKGDEKTGIKQAPFGEVVIHFNNEDGGLGPSAPSVGISRWINKSGKCEYRVNGKVVSRQDVVDLLGPVVSSPGGHNFVIQGTVRSIAEKNPIERREIMDELAGVGEYEEKKQKAIGELQTVDSNIGILEGGMREISNHMEGLRNQMEAAMEHNQLVMELEQAKAAFVKKRFDTLSRKVSKLRGDGAKISRNLNNLDGKYKHALKVAQEREKEWEKISKSIEAQERVGVIQKAENLRTQFSTLSSLQGSKIGKKERLITEIEALGKRLEGMAAEGQGKFSPLLSDFNRLHGEFLSLSGALASAKTAEEALGVVQSIQKVLENLAQVIKGISEHDFRSAQGGNKEFGELRDRLISLNAVRDSYEEELKGLDQKIRAAQSQLEKIKPEESRLRASIQSLREKSSKFMEEARKLRGSADSIHGKIQDLTYKRGTKMVEMATAEKELEEVEIQLKETEADPASFLRMDPDTLKVKIRELEGKVEAVGPINPLAARSFRETEDRYNGEKAKHDKLQADKQSLLDFMAKVEEKKKEIFMKTLGEISWHFNQIFAELSGGGTGELKLENEQSPFEGGLKMEVTFEGSPPGLQSLSGGQKTLTALAFILAIQRYRPTTFYVMDEIDEGLDPKNRSRVAEMLRKFSRESQIVVISHHNTIPSLADRVFGVIKENKVSRLYSVDLSGIGG